MGNDEEKLKFIKYDGDIYFPFLNVRGCFGGPHSIKHLGSYLFDDEDDQGDEDDR